MNPCVLNPSVIALAEVKWTRDAFLTQRQPRMNPVPYVLVTYQICQISPLQGELTGKQ